MVNIEDIKIGRYYYISVGYIDSVWEAYQKCVDGAGCHYVDFIWKKESGYNSYCGIHEDNLYRIHELPEILQIV